jgi:hypothetical protein
MTRFWYTLKNLDFNVGLISTFWNISLVLVYGVWYFDTICIMVSKYFSKLYMNMVYINKGYEMVTCNGINMTMVNFDLLVGI